MFQVQQAVQYYRDSGWTVALNLLSALYSVLLLVAQAHTGFWKLTSITFKIIPHNSYSNLQVSCGYLWSGEAIIYWGMLTSWADVWSYKGRHVNGVKFTGLKGRSRISESRMLEQQPTPQGQLQPFLPASTTHTRTDRPRDVSLWGLFVVSKAGGNSPSCSDKSPFSPASTFSSSPTLLLLLSPLFGAWEAPEPAGLSWGGDSSSRGGWRIVVPWTLPSPRASALVLSLSPSWAQSLYKGQEQLWCSPLLPPRDGGGQWDFHLL